ncbi:phospholipase C-like isoform X6 [Oculina patagonica]
MKVFFFSEKKTLFSYQLAIQFKTSEASTVTFAKRKEYCQRTMQILLLLPVLLVFGAAHGANYRVTVKTSGADWAGTDANVWIKIQGSNGETGGLRLDNPHDDFIVGSEDTFTVTGRDVGTVTAIYLKRDEFGRHDGWLPKYVAVQKNGGQGFLRYYDDWLPANQWVKIWKSGPPITRFGMGRK